MIQPNDFVYKQVHTGALRAGATEAHAHAHAVIALYKFKKNKFKFADKLIKESIKDAIKDTKKRR